MPAATEIALIFLKPDATIEEASSAAGQQFAKCRDLLKTQKGYQRQYWGRQIEDPKLLVWAIDWDDVSDHHNFMKADVYKEFFKTAAPIMDFETGPPHLIHANYASHPPNGPRNAPTTEFATFATSADATNEQKSAIEDAVMGVAKVVLDDGSSSAVSCGWIVEDLEHEKGSNGKATALSALIGWPSKEAHMKAREEEKFLEAAGPLRLKVLPPTPGYNGTTVYHAKMVEG